MQNGIVESFNGRMRGPDARRMPQRAPLHFAGRGSADRRGLGASTTNTVRPLGSLGRLPSAVFGATRGLQERGEGTRAQAGASLPITLKHHLREQKSRTGSIYRRVRHGEQGHDESRNAGDLQYRSGRPLYQRQFCQPTARQRIAISMDSKGAWRDNFLVKCLRRTIKSNVRRSTPTPTTPVVRSGDTSPSAIHAVRA